jgi:TRAP-type C4-dicarboxylate transport system substrate-binding protein
MISRSLRVACAAAVLLLATAGARAEPVALKFATLNAPQSFLVTRFIKPWTDRMVQQSNGALKIDLFNGFALASNLNVYDRVLDDVIQIAWGLPTYFGGKFVNTSVAGLPLLADDAESGSVALWRLYQRGALGHEYDDIHPLLLLAIPQQGIHTRDKKIETMADLHGLRINSGNRVTADIIGALGASPYSLNVGEMFEALQRGTVDGVFMPWTAFQPLKLGEVTHYHLDEALGTSAATIFMAKKKYDALPAEVKKVIDANSGEAVSRQFARVWDAEQAATRERTKTEKGHTVNRLSDAERARWDERFRTVTDAWTKATPNGAAMLASYKSEVAKAKAEEAH